jgi:hypothetical protein
MTPYLITAPASLPVTLSEMKAHLRVVHNDEDDDITAKQAGAVAALDGWGSALNRCIMPQVWAVDVIGPGPHVLPFPDATNIAAASNGNSLSVDVTRRGDGFLVAVDDALFDQMITITATYGLPAPRLSAAQTLVKLMVQREFDVMAGPDYEAITRSIDSVVSVLRWRRI